jgi:hypothetical protein
LKLSLIQETSLGWIALKFDIASTPILDASRCFRNEMEVGPGGKQIQIEDPDGNPIERFQPARH